jgi:hypothetical protein
LLNLGIAQAIFSETAPRGAHMAANLEIEPCGVSGEALGILAAGIESVPRGREPEVLLGVA